MEQEDFPISNDKTLLRNSSDQQPPAAKLFVHMFSMGGGDEGETVRAFAIPAFMVRGHAIQNAPSF